jgi:sterol desaturase/sphingolipid hydroxylase (fatty acid hydroxylase superfamily)
MIIIFAGLLLIGVAAILDGFFRVRMLRAGHRVALFAGGAFDFRKYHQERAKRGWPAWPVRLMWVAVIIGIVLIIVGFFTLFGTTPMLPK